MPQTSLWKLLATQVVATTFPYCENKLSKSISTWFLLFPLILLKKTREKFFSSTHVAQEKELPLWIEYKNIKCTSIKLLFTVMHMT